jgi:Fe-S oxidoreductase
MSVARLHTVNKARKDQGKCGKCGTPLPAGSPYRHFSVGFRSSYVQKRCMKIECTPRPSERESSKLSSVYAAMEAAEDELAGLRSADVGEQDTVTSIVTTVAEEVRTVADEYREADSYIGGGGSGSTVSEERADTLESAADELESFQPSADPADFTECEDAGDEDHDADTCEACGEDKARLWDELITEAETVLSEAEVS